ncbi:hypothetical protein DFH09DRAFT_939024, partial [Mycena vulgaris]
IYHNQQREIMAPREHATSGWDRANMRCWAILDMASRSCSFARRQGACGRFRKRGTSCFRSSATDYYASYAYSTSSSARSTRSMTPVLGESSPSYAPSTSPPSRRASL